MVNGASASSRVALISSHIRGMSAGRGCEDVGHINTIPEPAISTSPSRSKDNTCSPSPASTKKAATAACIVVTGRPRKIPRAIQATATRTVSDQASRSA